MLELMRSPPVRQTVKGRPEQRLSCARNPIREERDAQLTAQADIRSQVQEMLLPDRPQESLGQPFAAREAHTPHREGHERNDGLPIPSIQWERCVRLQFRHRHREVEKHRCVPIGEKQGARFAREQSALRGVMQASRSNVGFRNVPVARRKGSRSWWHQEVQPKQVRSRAIRAGCCGQAPFSASSRS